MKRHGFTLAEVMTALAITGVVASLTIPTFISSNRNKVAAGKLASISSSVENAFTSMIAAEAVQDLSETDFASSPNINTLGKYLVLAGTVSTVPTYHALNSSTTTITPEFDIIFQTKNNGYVMYKASDVPVPDDESHPGSIGTITIDVNGSAKPNRWGRDVFLFRVGYDGILYPAGGEKYKNMNSATALETCTGTTGTGCTQRLIENNYEPNY